MCRGVQGLSGRSLETDPRHPLDAEQSSLAIPGILVKR
jgi:hypothetical protein